MVDDFDYAASGRELYVDVGNDDPLSPTLHPTEDYVWLGAQVVWDDWCKSEASDAFANPAGPVAAGWSEGTCDPPGPWSRENKYLASDMGDE